MKKLALIITFLAAICFTTIAAAQNTEPEKIPFAMVEQKPTFQGEDANTFSKWVFSQITYPEIAKKNGVQGRVTLQFTIDTTGTVTDIKVLRGVDSSVDKEAVRVLSMSPKWEPGVQRGKKVKVIYTFPIIFSLPKGNECIGFENADQSTGQNEMSFDEVQEKPTFQGGGPMDFTKWVFSQITYPAIAKKNGVQGRVVLKFMIDTTGTVKNVRVIRGVDSSLDNEAKRVVSMSPKWEPGKIDGKPVNVTYTFPVVFSLK